MLLKHVVSFCNERWKNEISAYYAHVTRTSRLQVNTSSNFLKDCNKCVCVVCVFFLSIKSRTIKFVQYPFCCDCLRELKKHGRQRQRKLHFKINIWEMVTILLIIASSSHPLLLTEHASNGLVEPLLK